MSSLFGKLAEIMKTFFIKAVFEAMYQSKCDFFSSFLTLQLQKGTSEQQFSSREIVDYYCKGEKMEFHGIDRVKYQL